MKNSIHLSIENPCKENWEAFAPQTNGRYCSSCEKTIIDFTKLSDQAVLEFFASKSAKTCGRFRADQLKSYSFNNLVTASPGLALLKAGFLSLIFMLTINQTYAQTDAIRATSEVRSGVEASKGRRVNSESNTHFGGIVKDEDGNAMVAVNVLLKGTSTGTTTDDDGRFSFPVQLKAGDVLLFSFVGFETVEYTVASNEDTIIEMKMEYEITLGAVDVTGCYQEKQTLWSKIKNIF
ncbi:carboxypeptidase-like regulatory domain-containing protein [Chryseolinea sp. T2]|uniref:carboxypeptidase-like regulatory domain-containing protein n=1 Tax=Chryseolinea sp. T2 TaxID=3129255 RepID=UPI003078800E